MLLRVGIRGRRLCLRRSSEWEDEMGRKSLGFVEFYLMLVILC